MRDIGWGVAGPLLLGAITRVSLLERAGFSFGVGPCAPQRATSRPCSGGEYLSNAVTR